MSWAAAIGAQIADGLAAAHAAGVVHRDLKPRNVMLTRGGSRQGPRLRHGPDRRRSRRHELTSTGVTVGTARYMAPEQFAGGLVTQAADLYALGCMLYEMLPGNPPFVRRTPLTISREKHQHEPRRVRLLRSDVPEALARLVDRLLAKDPDRPARPTRSPSAMRCFLSLAEGSALPVWQDVRPGEVAAAAGQRSASRSRNPRLSEPAAPEPAKRALSGSGMDVFGVHEQLIKRLPLVHRGRHGDPRRADQGLREEGPRRQVAVARPVAVAEPVLRFRRHGRANWSRRECCTPSARGSSRPGSRRAPRAATAGRSPCTATSGEAIEAAAAGDSYVLTTGTGSGKSLAYIVPIVDRVLQERSGRARRARRVRAIVVYPMNALANSQLEELEKFLRTATAPATSRSPSPATPARRTTRSAQAILRRTRRTSCSPTT